MKRQTVKKQQEKNRKYEQIWSQQLGRAQCLILCFLFVFDSFLWGRFFSESVFVSAFVFPHMSGEDCQILCQPATRPPSSFLLPSSATPQLQALDRSVPRWTPTATCGSKCTAPDLHRKLRTRVFPAGPPPQAQDQSVPRRTSTASSGSECSPPDLNCKLWIKVFCAGPEPQKKPGDIADRMPERRSEDLAYIRLFFWLMSPGNCIFNPKILDMNSAGCCESCSGTCSWVCVLEHRFFWNAVVGITRSKGICWNQLSLFKLDS